MPTRAKASVVATGAVLFLAALTLRIALVSTARFSDDEAGFFQIACDLVTGKSFPLLGPAITGGKAKIPGPLFFYFIAGSQLLGPWPEAGNAIIALYGALTVLFFWLALRREFGEAAAAFSAFLLSFAPWHVFFSDHLTNGPLFIFMSVVALWAAMKLRKSPRSPAIAVLFFAAASLPQLHLSCPAVWAGLLVLVLPTRREWNRKWLAVGIVAGLALYLPYAVFEWKTGFSNLSAFFSEKAARRSTSFRLVPLYVFRFLTLDVTDFELMGSWGRYSQAKAVATLFTGTEFRPFHILRLISTISSFILAGWAVYRAFHKEKPKGGTDPFKIFRQALLAALVTDMALLGILGKVFFSHYALPVLPFAFVCYAHLYKVVSPSRRRWLVAGGLIFMLGGIECSLAISRRLDARNGLAVQRFVLAHIAEAARAGKTVSLDFGFHSSELPYKVLAKELMHFDLKFTPNAEARFYIGSVNETIPAPWKNAQLIGSVGPVVLYRL